LKTKRDWLIAQIATLTFGMDGVMMTSCKNDFFGKIPTGILMYVSMVFMFILPKIDH